MTQQIAFLQSSFTSDQFRLVEISDNKLFDELCMAGRKRPREDGAAEEENPPARTFTLKANNEGVAICTSASETFSLRRVAYSNSVYIMEPNPPKSLTKAAGEPDGLTSDGSSAVTSVILEKVPFILETVRRRPNFGGVAQYLLNTSIPLEELDVDMQTAVSSKTGEALKTWSQLEATNCVSAGELKEFLAEWRAVVHKGYVRIIESAVEDACILALVAQVDAMEGTEPWKSVEIAQLESKVSYPALVLASALQRIGVAYSTDGKTCELSAEGITAAVGIVVLKRQYEVNGNKPLHRREFQLEWIKSVPVLLQEHVDVALLKGHCVTTINADTLSYCDIRTLPFEPRDRLNALLDKYQRISAEELRRFMMPCFLPNKDGKSADLDALLGKACREHKNKQLGTFFSLE